MVDCKYTSLFSILVASLGVTVGVIWGALYPDVVASFEGVVKSVFDPAAIAALIAAYVAWQQHVVEKNKLALSVLEKRLDIFYRFEELATREMHDSYPEGHSEYSDLKTLAGSLLGTQISKKMEEVWGLSVDVATETTVKSPELLKIKKDQRAAILELRDMIIKTARVKI